MLLVFYPFAFTRICTGELCQLRDELAAFADADVQVLAVSTDPSSASRRWRAGGLEFPLLSDFWPHGAVAQAYGVFNEKAGMAIRGTFLIDAEGRSPSPRSTRPGDAREQSGWKAAVAALAA